MGDRTLPRGRACTTPFRLELKAGPSQPRTAPPFVLCAAERSVFCQLAVGKTRLATFHLFSVLHRGEGSTKIDVIDIAGTQSRRAALLPGSMLTWWSKPSTL